MKTLKTDSERHKRYWISTYAELKIPLPPLDQQKKIAAILDAADAYRQKTKALITKYEELTQSLFMDMFGDPVRNPMEWEKVPTIKYCDCIVPGRDKPKSFTGNLSWITTGDLIHLGFVIKSRLNIGLSQDEISEVRAKVIPKNSVIMTCVGDLGVISINTNDIVMNQQLHAFICHDELNNVFLMHNLSYQTPYMNKMASSTTVPYMNKTVANNTPTIVPPIELQNQFADSVKAIESQKAQAQASLVQAEDLFNSLLQRAFKGELS
jgi:type I restriction enzyme S subunit